MQRFPFKKKIGHMGIRYTIFTYFTVTALVAAVLIGIAMYQQMSAQLSIAIEEENRNLVRQVGRSVDTYLRTIMKLSDSLYYGTIKNANLSDGSISQEITLLYDNNKESVDNIVLFSKEGTIMESVPAARLKTRVDVTKEAWFEGALARPENIWFSTPHVQYIFDNASGQYRWVISMCRAVEITEGPFTNQGVLMLDLRYSSLEQMLSDVKLGNDGYLYLISGSGEIIYHPKAQLIDSGLAQENNFQRPHTETEAIGKHLWGGNVSLR
ncbi:cache domain-containing protein [Clostridium sp. AM58-1XD]|uniref:cache domain-containing protein n=1 Tax=Clostridium sp. AM58-1XD TaxID=2292307 RepID=UPI0026A06D52